MKVLHVINSLDIGGAEQLVTKLLPSLKNRCVECDLLLLKKTNSFLESELIEKGIKVFFATKYNVYNPLSIIGISKYINNYDIIHVHLFPALYWVAIAKLVTKSNCKLLFTEHSTSNRRRNNIILRYVDKFIYTLYDKIICISDGVKTELLKHIDVNAKVNVIPNGIVLNNFNSKEINNKHLQLPGDTFVLTQISSFRSAKDQDTVIKAMKYINFNVVLVLVGDGPRKEELKYLAEIEGATKKVLFLGVRNDIPEIIAESDIIIVSSHWEGFGIAAVEGMAGGKPVLASKVSGLNEVVNNDELLFKKGDFRELATKINKILSDPIKYEELKKFSLDQSRKFDIETTINKYLAQYENLFDEI